MFYNSVQKTTNYIKKRISLTPTIGIILGSGLGSLVDKIENKQIIPYKDIPNFPQSKVTGHEYNLVFGKIGKNNIAAMQGRFHFYEGYSLRDLTFPIYVLKELGITSLIVTNACGGINSSFTPGDLMLITDHINMLGNNPLIGDNDERFGPRFPDMSEAYSKELIKHAKESSNKLNIELKEGVYALYSGPSYETAAEIKAYKNLGADAIGMSTVPEVIVANYLQIKVLGISCITNMATGIAKTKHSHEEVLEVANKSSKNLCLLVEDIIKTV